MKLLRKIKKDDKGQSLAEFSVVLPLILLLIFAMITIGFFIYSKMLVVLASSQAARVGSEIISSSELTQEEKYEKIEDTAFTFLSNGITGNDRSVDINVEGEQIKVNVKYDFKLILPLLGDIFGDKAKIPIEYESVYLIE